MHSRKKDYIHFFIRLLNMKRNLFIILVFFCSALQASDKSLTSPYVYALYTPSNKIGRSNTFSGKPTTNPLSDENNRNQQTVNKKSIVVSYDENVIDVLQKNPAKVISASDFATLLKRDGSCTAEEVQKLLQEKRQKQPTFIERNPMGFACACAAFGFSLHWYICRITK